MTRAAAAGNRRPAPNRLITTASTIDTRSIEMYTMHEALARERLRTSQRDAHQLRVARELAAARRWHRVEHQLRAVGRRAHRVERRHALRAG